MMRLKWIVITSLLLNALTAQAIVNGHAFLHFEVESDGSGTTGYYAPVHGRRETTETNRQLYLPTALRVSNLYVHCTASVTRTITVRKNGAGTAVTCSMSSAQNCSDTSHDVDFAAGDLLSLETTGGTGSWECQAVVKISASGSNTTKHDGILAFADNSFTNLGTASNYCSPSGGSGSAGAYNCQDSSITAGSGGWIFPSSGSVTALGFHTDVGGGGVNDITFKNNTDGTSSDLTVSKNNVTDGSDTSCTSNCAYDAGDLVTVQWGTKTGTLNGTILLEYNSPPMITASGTVPNGGTTTYCAMYGDTGGAACNTTANATMIYQIAPAASRLGNLRAVLTVTQPFDVTFTACYGADNTVFPSTCTSAPTCTITAGNTTCSDTSTFYELAQGQSHILKVVTAAGTVNAATFSASYDLTEGDPTATPTVIPTATATATPTSTPANTATSTPMDTPTVTPTDTPTDTPTATNTPTPIPTNCVNQGTPVAGHGGEAEDTWANIGSGTIWPYDKLSLGGQVWKLGTDDYIIDTEAQKWNVGTPPAGTAWTSGWVHTYFQYCTNDDNYSLAADWHTLSTPAGDWVKEVGTDAIAPIAAAALSCGWNDLPLTNVAAHVGATAEIRSGLIHGNVAPTGRNNFEQLYGDSPAELVLCYESFTPTPTATITATPTNTPTATRTVTRTPTPTPSCAGGVQTTITKNPGLCVSTNYWFQGGGSAAWVDPMLANSEDGLEATFTVADLGEGPIMFSEWLSCTDWDFGVPAGATVQSVKIITKAERDCNFGPVNWRHVHMFKDLTLASDLTDNSLLGCGLSTKTWTVDNADLPTAAQVNSNTDFGAAVSVGAYTNGEGDKALVDNIQMQVQYCAANTPSPTPTATPTPFDTCCFCQNSTSQPPLLDKCINDTALCAGCAGYLVATPGTIGQTCETGCGGLWRSPTPTVTPTPIPYFGCCDCGEDRPQGVCMRPIRTPSQTPVCPTPQVGGAPCTYKPMGVCQ